MSIRSVVLAVLLSLAPSIASADPWDGDGRADRAGMRPMRQLRMRRIRRQARAYRRILRFERAIQRFDANGDGRLDQSEVGDRFARFQRFDLNGDGWITLDEVIRARPGRPQPAR